MGASGDRDRHPVPDLAALAALLHTLNERPEPTMRPPASFWEVLITTAGISGFLAMAYAYAASGALSCPLQGIGCS